MKRSIENEDVERPTAKRHLGPSLTYPPLNEPGRPVAFQKPSILLTFSYTPHPRRLEFGDVSLKYYVEPPRNANLGHGMDRWVRRPEERGRIDTLCEAWTRIQPRTPAAQIGVVSWRGVMTKILTAPYEEREGWELNIMNVSGTLYFEEHQSEERLRERNDMKPHHRRQTYYGYAFESYCTRSTEGPHRPGWGGDVDTNEQWASVVKTKLGDTRLLIGGEVDCVRGRYKGTTDNFVELKTSLVIRGPEDEARFEKKLLKFYFQSFLLGVPEIIVGFRTTSGYLSELQSFQTMQLARMVRGKPGGWDPSICLSWAERFIKFAQETTNRPSGDRDEEPMVWRARFEPKRGVEIYELDSEGILEVVNGEDRVGFLPRWYYEQMVEGVDGRN